MIKIGAVFVISFSTITIVTAIFARWVAYIGYGVALLLLFGSNYSDWVFMAFPLWILLVSIYILKDNFRRASSDNVNSPG
jgi:uncharacterized membrane protein